MFHGGDSIVKQIGGVGGSEVTWNQWPAESLWAETRGLWPPSWSWGDVRRSIALGTTRNPRLTQLLLCFFLLSLSLSLNRSSPRLIGSKWAAVGQTHWLRGFPRELITLHNHCHPFFFSLAWYRGGRHVSDRLFLLPAKTHSLIETYQKHTQHLAWKLQALLQHMHIYVQWLI